jgi:diaminopimelate epimerase
VGKRVLQVKQISASDFQVNMGKALLDWQDIPLSKECDPQNLALLPSKDSLNIISNGFSLNIGNPHIIFFIQDIEKISLKDDVAWLEKDPLFSEGVNINIAQIVNKNHIKLKVWERGAGATLACGTGACASFYAAYKCGLVSNWADVCLPGGKLQISVTDNQEIFMLGSTNMQEVRDI